MVARRLATTVYLKRVVKYIRREAPRDDIGILTDIENAKGISVARRLATLLKNVEKILKNVEKMLKNMKKMLKNAFFARRRREAPRDRF